MPLFWMIPSVVERNGAGSIKAEVGRKKKERSRYKTSRRQSSF